MATLLASEIISTGGDIASRTAHFLIMFSLKAEKTLGIFLRDRDE